MRNHIHLRQINDFHWLTFSEAATFEYNLNTYWFSTVRMLAGKIKKVIFHFEIIFKKRIQPSPRILVSFLLNLPFYRKKVSWDYYIFVQLVIFPLTLAHLNHQFDFVPLLSAQLYLDVPAPVHLLCCYHLILEVCSVPQSFLQDFHYLFEVD